METNVEQHSAKIKKRLNDSAAKRTTTNGNHFNEYTEWRHRFRSDFKVNTNLYWLDFGAATPGYRYFPICRP